MARRRRRRQPDTIELLLELAGPVVALIFLLGFFLRFFAPQILQAILGLIVLVGVVLLCAVVAVVLFFVIRKTAQNKPARPGYSSLFPDVTWPKDDPPKVPTLEEKLRAIDWFQFEKLVAAVYETYGCNVKRLGGANPDRGIDLIAEKNGERTVVQCKHWRHQAVKVREVRELLGTLKDANIESGVLVALSGCTEDARALADKHGIAIVDEAGLVKLIRQPDSSIDQRITAIFEDDTKYCPKCEHPMVLRTAGKGPNPGEQFWGCSQFPHCHYTQPIA